MGLAETREMMICRMGSVSLGLCCHEVLTVLSRDKFPLFRKKIPGTSINMAHLSYKDYDVPVFPMSVFSGERNPGGVRRFLLLQDGVGSLRCAVGVGEYMDVVDVPLRDIGVLPSMISRKTAAPLFWGVWYGEAPPVVLFTLEKVEYISDLAAMLVTGRKGA